MSAAHLYAQALVLLTCASCGAKVAAPPAREPTTPSSATAADEPGPCPRVERAKRMWSGFLVDVPSEAMVQALEVVVPIQVALGETFCAEALRDCRPAELLAIDLTDERASAAHVRVRLLQAGAARELRLVLRPAGDSWRAEPASLTDYLAACRTQAPRAASVEPSGSERELDEAGQKR